MMDNYADACDEVKRVDHLVHVSLKYTRTVDVLLSVLNRFISCTDFLMNSLFLKAKDENKIIDIPETPVEKVASLKQLYNNQIIHDWLDNYLLFRRLTRAKYTKRNEFRRYVTMTVEDNGTIIEIDIDRVVEFYEKLKVFLTQVRTIINA